MPLTFAQLSFWSNYLPRVAANIGGRSRQDGDDRRGGWEGVA